MSLKVKIFVPIEIEITHPIDALNAFIKDWGDDLENRDEINSIDLILHAGKINQATVIIPDDITNVDWVYCEGHSDDDNVFTRSELEKIH